MTDNQKLEHLVQEIEALVHKQVEFGTIDPGDIFPNTGEVAISGKGIDGAALLYLHSLARKLCPRK